MANAETREWRKKAHEIFDSLWKSSKGMSREKAYGLLQSHFGFVVHIGESDVEMCKNIINFADEKGGRIK